MTALNMAVVGVGALGRHHARILSELPEVNLVAVVDSDQAQGQAVAGSAGTSWHPDCTTLPENIEAVSIAVPTAAHLPVAAPFLERGVSVLVEKPIAPNVHDARGLVALAQDNGCTLQVGHVERFNPATVAALPRMQQPRYIRSERVSPYTFRSTDIGVVLDLMIHDLDLVLAVADSEIESVEAFGASVFGEHEDVAQARIRFRNGCVADLTASRVSPAASRTMQAWSAAGCTTVDFATRQVTSYGPGPALLAGQHQTQPPASIAERGELMKSVFGRFISVDEVTVSDDDALTAQLREFADCVRSGAKPTVGGAEALAAIETADLVLQNISAHCWDGTPAGRVGPNITPPQLRAA